MDSPPPLLLFTCLDVSRSKALSRPAGSGLLAKHWSVFHQPPTIWNKWSFSPIECSLMGSVGNMYMYVMYVLTSSMLEQYCLEFAAAVYIARTSQTLGPWQKTTFPTRWLAVNWKPILKGPSELKTFYRHKFNGVILFIEFWHSH